jgi:hypothetical protein
MATGNIERLKQLYVDALDESPKVDLTPQRRFAVRVVDVDNHLLREVLVPFGLSDPLSFALLVIGRFSPEVAVVSTAPHTESSEAVVTVSDCGPV